MFKRLMALFTAALMVLTMTACQKKPKQLVTHGDAVVARVYDTKITKLQLYAALASYVSNYKMTMSDITAESQLEDKLVSDFLNDMVMDYALAHDPSKYGYEYTDAEAAEFEAQYKEFLDQVDEANRTGAAALQKDSDQFVEKQLELRKQYFTLMGYTEDEYKEFQRCAFVAKRIKDTYINGAVNVDEATVKSYYDNMLKKGEKSMALTYTFSIDTPSLTLYCDKGYRYVKALLLAFPPQSVINNSKYYSSGDTDNLKKSIEQDTKDIQSTIDEVKAKLAAGQSFDSLVEEYGTDDGMKVEPYKSKGYIAVTGDTKMIPEYREACEKLTDTTMVSECATYRGYWFLQASEIVDKGPMPFDEIKGQLTKELTTMEQNIGYTQVSKSLIDQLEKSGDVEINLKNFYKK